MKFYKKYFFIRLHYLRDRLRGRSSDLVVIGDITLRLSFRHQYQHHIIQFLKNGEYEKDLLVLWREYSRTSTYILDIGGYNGIYGLISAVANPRAHVYIFEPDPINSAHIRENIQINNLNNVEVIQAAVSNFSGHATFRQHVGGTGGHIQDKLGDIEVPVISLDTWLEQKGIVSVLMKIDVEGFEYQVLQGAQKTLQNSNQIVFLEVHNKRLASMNISENNIWNLLHRLRYTKKELEKNDQTTHFLVSKIS